MLPTLVNQLIQSLVAAAAHKTNISTYLAPQITPSLFSLSSKIQNKMAFSSPNTLTHRRFYSIIETDNDKSSKLLDGFDNFIFDYDGVIYVGNDPIDGAVATIQSLISVGKNVLFVTNNSSKSRPSLTEKFASLGFPCDHLKVVTAASSAAFHCRKLLVDNRNGESGKVFFIGMDGLREELYNFELETIWASDLKLPRNLEEWQLFQIDPKVRVVVVGADWDFNYAKATAAASYLVSGHVHFIGTDRDAYFPTPNTHIRQVGTGSLVKMVATGSGRDAFYVGKPDQAMWEHIEDEYEKMDLSRTLLVGDTLYSDIEFANSRGVATLLVETGNHTREHVQKNLSKTLQIPTYIAKSLKHALLIQ